MSHIKKSENRTWTYKIICIKNDQSFVLWSMFILYPNTSTTKSQYGDELNSTVSQTQRWLIHMGLCLLLYPLKIQSCNSHRLKHLSGGKLQDPNTRSISTKVVSAVWSKVAQIRLNSLLSVRSFRKLISNYNGTISFQEVIENMSML